MRLYNNGRLYVKKYNLSVQFLLTSARAEMSFMGEQIKIGTFDTVESAFGKYKEYKEDFIKKIAGQNRERIPYKVYEAMMGWKIEIDD